MKRERHKILRKKKMIDCTLASKVAPGAEVDACACSMVRQIMVLLIFGGLQAFWQPSSARSLWSFLSL